MVTGGFVKAINIEYALDEYSMFILKKVDTLVRLLIL